MPNPKAIPHLWKYTDIKPLLLGIHITFQLTIAAGDFVSDHEAERRVLQLINPALSHLRDNPADK
jgi:gentisate 1,2-dioxygenase